MQVLEHQARLHDHHDHNVPQSIGDLQQKEPLELGETCKLFEHDLILDNLWQLADDDVACVFVVERRSSGHHEVLDRAQVPLYARHDIYRLDDVRAPHLLSQGHSFRG